jgi:formyl-CoA transferase/CoA:oxalate CoA-transferase
VKGVLDGIRILDLTRHMAGPYATAMLSDFGADVIKIEGMPFGDPSRRTGIHDGSGDSPLFVMWNRGKRSVALDLRAEQAAVVLDRLVDSCDVLVENFRPGVTERMGLGWDVVSERNPRLVYCSVTGFGSTGPLADTPATDPVVQAFSGVMSVTGPRDGDPVLVGVPIADFTGAMLAVQGILLALLAREQTGRGQRVDVSLFGGLVSALSTRLATHWATGETPERFGNAHSVVVPYQLFRTADGMVVAGTWGPGDWPRFCAAVGHEDLVDDPRFATNDDRIEHRDELVALLQATFATRTTDEWQAAFREANALFTPLATIPEAVAHPQTEHLGLIEEVPHPTLGLVKVVKSPVSMSASPPAVRRPPPRLGEHTWEVLAEVGLDDERIRSLVDQDVVRLVAPAEER